ncbi:alpha/beta fold hydrolase [Euzebya tangerina]|uniref:alpha/beta fold hydrolase n=1 Tax=Euzebya tangerina TaxID=591198 RepID=UPI0013C2D62B|nr:alpha/beta fold hydrolase [Euzebya tangerina]
MRVPLVLGLALLLLACVELTPVEQDDSTELDATVVTEAEQVPQRPIAGPEVTDVICPDPPPALDDGDEAGSARGLRCGFIVVPEDRSRPDGPIVEVAFTVISPGAEPIRGPPLIVVPDGPGFPGLSQVGVWRASPLSLARQVVVFDPRGAGRSFPSLDCGPGGLDRLTDRRVGECRDQLTSQGIDLGSYNTSAIAQDVVALLRALGLDRVDLLGVGHGARVMQSILALAPDRVRAVVFDSPIPDLVDVYFDVGLNAQAALNRLLDECAGQPSCAERFDESMDQLPDALAVLGGPTGSGSAGGSPDGSQRPPTADEFALALIEAMRGTANLGLIPSVIDQLAVDPAGALERLTSPEEGEQDQEQPESLLSEGLLLSSECHDEVPFSSFDPEDPPPALDVIGGAVSRLYARVPRACATWDVAAGAEQSGGETEVFALVLNGEFDPLVSPAWAAEATRDIAEATVVQIDAAGHRLFDLDACTVGLVDTFLSRPGLSTDGLLRAAEDVAPACATPRAVEFDLS